MPIAIVPTRAFADQRPGTAGLRKRLTVFRQANYLENFVQSVFDGVPELRGGSIVVGGDGRLWNREAIRILLCLAAANGVTRASVARGGLLSTPAASMQIRARGATGGFLLTASHNPGGPEGDFGIKFNVAGGGQASVALCDRIHSRSREIHRYKLLENAPELELDELGEQQFGAMVVEVFDPVPAYADALEQLFDFERIRGALHGGLKIHFDALNGVSGPFAEEILVRRLGVSAASVVRSKPLPDFGGKPPDPNPHNCAALVALAGRADAPDLIAASDGDGDRNLILGKGVLVSPCDSLALLAANATQIPGYAAGLKGVARSMPTSRALDRVAAKLGIPCHETPTGWRHFCNLLESGRVTLCGEESYGTSSDHAREKDGLWAVLFWLDLMAATRLSVRELLERHWAEFGRDYHLREDWLVPDANLGRSVLDGAVASVASLPGRRCGALTVESADSFAYTDPVDGSVSRNQGLRVLFVGGARGVLRASGTDTTGVTLRFYAERHAPPGGDHALAPVQALSEVVTAMHELTRVRELTGLAGPKLVV